jgi:CubicO group peptidase (beta-lactamase class C family)
MTRARVFQILSVFLSVLSSFAAAERAGKRARYGEAIHRLEQVARSELERKIVTGFSLVLVDEEGTVYANGFGYADKERRVPATADTVYRAGSISKLFTALAAMQLAEQGKLDIDAPVVNYAPQFRIVIPFPGAKPITLRQLMCHRSGLVRESPVGGYFDDSEPSVTDSIASLAQCVLVNPPDTKTRYSNIGVTVVGHVVSTVAAMPFEAYQNENLLGPIGMTNSGFSLTRTLRARLAAAYMRVARAGGAFEEIKAPVFQLGTIPAGNLYATAEDLARFIQFLLDDGSLAGGQLISSRTLAEMFRPQLIDGDTGFGLGFHVGKFRSHRKISHTGAVYGFTSSLIVLPEQKIGVIVLANEDIATGPVQRLSDTALDLMLEARIGEKPPSEPVPFPLSPSELKTFVGDFESQSYWARIEVQDGKLNANISGQPMTFTAVKPMEFVADGRYVHRASIVFTNSSSGRGLAFVALGQTFERVDAQAAAEIPAAWQKYLGSYGPKFIPLIVSARHGHLYAMTENMLDYRLTPLNRTVFNMPPGLYTDEQLVFLLDRSGRVPGAILANMTLKRNGR